MKNLWTPWRMAYITGREGREEDCIFDRTPDLTHDKGNLILCRDHSTVVLLNRFPYANGHLLVAPKRHVADIVDLTAEENGALMQTIQKSVTILRKHFTPDGFNIGLNIGEVAGAGLADHLHFHVIPRWDGDHNFMTVLAEVRTIPQHIEQTFDLLVPEFQKISGTQPRR
jgi:ATP adenylyltransferase